MNLLEHYIKEIHSVVEIERENIRFLKVDLTYDCYGKVERDTRPFFHDEWEDAKAKGYFMA